jgi:hypothetical protein
MIQVRVSGSSARLMIAAAAVHEYVLVLVKEVAVLPGRGHMRTLAGDDRITGRI